MGIRRAHATKDVGHGNQRDDIERVSELLIGNPPFVFLRKSKLYRVHLRQDRPDQSSKNCRYCHAGDEANKFINDRVRRYRLLWVESAKDKNDQQSNLHPKVNARTSSSHEAEYERHKK